MMEKRELKHIKIYIENLLVKAVDNHVFSGAAAGISIMNNLTGERFTGNSGKNEYGKNGENIGVKTYFDLASLTKPLVTALCIFNLIDRKKINFKSKLSLFFPEIMDDDKKNINIEMLLSHSAGFSSYKPFFNKFSPVYNHENKRKIVQLILSDILEYKPGNMAVYSDFDYILLGEIIERVTGINIDVFFREKITKPLHLENEIFFIPLVEGSKNKRYKFAATEKCCWRNKIIKGEVHDEHCWLMGGVSGHAGLFGTVNGVLGLCEHILAVWKGKKGVVEKEYNSLRKVLNKKERNYNWCYGFDTPTPGKSSAGDLISIKSVGHLGFTGTSFWIDPVKNIVMVLLSNRIHPDRNNILIRNFRPKFHNNVFRWFIDQMKE